MTKWIRIAALVMLPVMAACTSDDEGGGTDVAAGGDDGRDALARTRDKAALRAAKLALADARKAIERRIRR